MYTNVNVNKVSITSVAKRCDKMWYVDWEMCLIMEPLMGAKGRPMVDLQARAVLLFHEGDETGPIWRTLNRN